MNLLRRKYYIYPEIQKPLLKFVLTSVIAVSALQSLFIYLSMKWLERTTKLDMTIIVDHRVLGSWKNLLFFSIALPMVVNVLLGAFIVLYVSNKFAGPLFRLERELDLYAKGEKNVLNVQFREGDFLKSLALKINRLR